MMQILTREIDSRLIVKQRLSDGSDRQEIDITRYMVKVMQDDKVYVLDFDNDPTEQEIKEAYDTGKAVESKESGDLILLLRQKLKDQTELSELLLQMQLEKEGIL